MGNESHKEDRNAYPIRLYAHIFSVVSADFQQHIISAKGGKKGARHCVEFTSASAEITAWLRGSRTKKTKTKSSLFARGRVSGFLVRHFIYLEFGTDASWVTGTEHCVTGAAAGPFGAS